MATNLQIPSKTVQRPVLWTCTAWIWVSHQHNISHRFLNRATVTTRRHMDCSGIIQQSPAVIMGAGWRWYERGTAALVKLQIKTRDAHNHNCVCNKTQPFQIMVKTDAGVCVLQIGCCKSFKISLVWARLTETTTGHSPTGSSRAAVHQQPERVCDSSPRRQEKLAAGTRSRDQIIPACINSNHSSQQTVFGVMVAEMERCTFAAGQLRPRC